MNTTNLLSKLIKSDKLETVEELNQALKYIGVNHGETCLNRNQAIEIGKVIVDKFACLADITKLVESIKELISIEEMDVFRNEIVGKLGTTVTNSIPASICQKRMLVLKTSFEEVSGDSVL